MVGLVVVALACGGGGGGAEAERPPADLTPLPLVLPTFVLGELEGMEEIDGRWVVREGCAGAAQRLRIEEAGRMTWTVGEAPPQALQGTALEFGADASLAIPWTATGAQGVLTLEEAEPEQYLAAGLPGVERLRLARVAGPTPPTARVERLLPPARDCGGRVDLGPLGALAGRAYAPGGDPCFTAAFRLDAGARRLEMSGESWAIVGARTTPEGTWLSLRNASDRPFGLLVSREADGVLRVWRPAPDGMHCEDLSPRRGTCPTGP